MDLKITAKKSVQTYLRAATRFLTGSPKSEDSEAKEPVDFLRIAGLGNAASGAAFVASSLETAGLAEVVSVQTSYPDMCALLVVCVKRKGAASALPLIKYNPFASTHAKARPVHVWLPPGYDADTEAYSVLYMQDGQNLWEDSQAAFGTSWSLADAMAELMKSNKIRKTLVVGPFNGEVLRFREYVPANVVERLSPATREKLLAQPQYGGEALSTGYIKFLVEELKPFVDANYRTKKDRENTFVMGSSMGGLISMHAVLTHPDVFAAAGCVSTHWPLSIEEETLEKEKEGWMDDVKQAFKGYLEEKLPEAGRHRFWFDYGSEHLDAHYEPYQQEADKVFEKKGYVAGKDVVTKAYPGAGHNEASWRDRVREPLEFLLGK